MRSVNDADTDVAADTAIVHGPTPEQPPPVHPPKTELAAGVAVNVTVEPLVNWAVQVVPQLMPAGAEATVPEPVPVRLTVTGEVFGANCAVTVVSAVIDTVHGPVPVHALPDHPVNTELASGVAVRVTDAPGR